MAGSRTRMSNDVQKNLEKIGLESLGPKLDALGVRNLNDLSLVDDADLVRWGLSTIERRRFFAHVRSLLGESEPGASFLPPSALTTAAASKKTSRASTRPDIASASVGPARLDELLGRGSAEHQVPRLAERVLSATGPLDVTELASRLQRAAPALAQGYDATEWPQFVEASVRSYKRLQVEDGVLAGDRPVVSICNTVLFSASEEVVADTACWLRVAMGLGTPAQVSVLACLCRASREVADGPAVWSKLLTRWYPKATLLNPDWVAQSDLEKRLEAALENDYALAALTRRIQPDTPVDIGELLRALPQQTTPKALIKFMSKHQENFRQSRDGKMFCISRQEGDLEKCKDWLTVNPFTPPPVPKSSDSGTAGAEKERREPTPVPMGRPSELGSRPLQEAKPEEKQEEAPPPPQAPQICQQLDPKQAFRLYHTGLLSQRTDQSKRGKLEAWEYYTESNSKCVMAAGDLLDLSECRVKAIRNNDPAVVHELVAQTLEGVVAKVPFGFWNRRVRVISNALNASQLRIGREQRKKFERKLLEFMEWVKKERGFGFYRCDACGSRWKSGFSYEEITQQCLGCGAWQKPYRIQDLESKADREAREKGEPVSSGKGGSKGVNTRTQQQPHIQFTAPVLEHGEHKRSWSGASGAENKRWRGEGGSAWSTDREHGPPRTVAPPPGRGRGGKGAGRGLTQGRWPTQRPPEAEPEPAPVQTSAAPAAQPASGTTTTANRWSAGAGGFFARRRAEGAAAAASSESGAPAASTTAAGASNGAATSASSEAASAVQPATDASSTPSESAPAAKYTPGGGGFFVRRRAQAAGAASSESGPTGSADASSGAGSTEAPSSAVQPATSAVPAPSDTAPPARYKPGGGGFFARRNAEAAGASSTSASANANGESSTAAGSDAAGDVPMGSSSSKDAGPSDDGPSVSSDKLQALQELGLSLEEAMQMGLVPATSSSSMSVDAEG
mmetsp:Transcript_12892/g.40505  ORF Transcript_12892/g.40505 Transcript_12892/m.40505 type:complete len:963 (+) Transcript_12892:176-3064(+)